MQDQRGIALLIALMVTVLLAGLCLSLTFSSLNESQISNEFENHEKALMIADAGLNMERQGLRGDDLNTVLTQTTQVTLWGTDSVAFNWARRNPLSPIYARNFDSTGIPSEGTVVQVPGLLTPAAGKPLGGGRYFAKLTDNDDGDNDLTRDVDGTVFLRVMGLYSSSAAGPSGGRGNSVSIVEALLHRDTSLKMTSPVSLVAKHVVADFQGQPFLVDGYDHPGHARDYSLGQHQSPANDTGLVPFYGMNCLYKAAPLESPPSAVNEILQALAGIPQNVTGLGGTSSVADRTIYLAGDQQSVVDAAYLQSLVVRLRTVADLVLPGGSTLNTAEYGTWEQPKIVYVDGDCYLREGFEGAGILVARALLSSNAEFEYEGLILVVGDGSADFEGSNKVVLGAIVLAKVETGSQGPAFGTPTLHLHGNDQILFSGQAVQMALNMAPLRVLSWREITPEVEPLAWTHYWWR